MIVFVRTRGPRMLRYTTNAPNIVETVTRDTAIYFSVIFTSHFVLVLMLTLVRVRAYDGARIRLS